MPLSPIAETSGQGIKNMNYRETNLSWEIVRDDFWHGESADHYP